MAETIYDMLDCVEREAELEIISPTEAYLQSIYGDPALPPGVRMHTAVTALPFERPKLAVTAHLDGGVWLGGAAREDNRAQREGDWNSGD